MKHPAVSGINNLLIHDYGMGHYAVSLHIEGSDGQGRADLYAAAQEISYKLFAEMDCDATIQTDFLITDLQLVQNINDVAEQAAKAFEETARIKDLHMVQAGSSHNVVLTAAGSRRLLKQENAVKDAVETAIRSIDTNFQVITKVHVQ